MIHHEYPNGFNKLQAVQASQLIRLLSSALWRGVLSLPFSFWRVRLRLL